MLTKIPASVFDFLKDIKENNNREWFAENKTRYQKQHEFAVSFADSLINKMQTVDSIETPSGKKSIFRIYKDVRFSKDKSPYKINIGGGGFWNPNPDDLKHIREQIASDPQPLRDILASTEFIHHFRELQGEKLKSAPKGFDKNHPAIDLLNFKQFLLMKTFTDEEVMSEHYLETLFETFKAMRPFFDYMSEILTTDLNGEVIV
jgi:uncharacterized protein (DUF2461 family)